MKLFQERPVLCRICKSVVGVHVLARKLMEMQAASIAKNLPDIVKKINDNLERNEAALGQMPQNLSGVVD